MEGVLCNSEKKIPFLSKREQHYSSSSISSGMVKLCGLTPTREWLSCVWTPPSRLGKLASLRRHVGLCGCAFLAASCMIMSFMTICIRPFWPIGLTFYVRALPFAFTNFNFVWLLELITISGRLWQSSLWLCVSCVENTDWWICVLNIRVRRVSLCLPSASTVDRHLQLGVDRSSKGFSMFLAWQLAFSRSLPWDVRIPRAHFLTSQSLCPSFYATCSVARWLMAGAGYSERRVLLAGCWWLVCSERKVLLVGGW
jgi:hypothetical protein